MKRLFAFLLPLLIVMACTESSPTATTEDISETSEEIDLLENAASKGGQPKVDVCHLTGNGSYRLISIAQPALPAHLNHGDGQPGDPVPGMDGFVFDDSCEAVVALPTDGLVLYYPFNGNANDESDNNNDGTVNGATLTTDRFGVENSAYSCDGVDDYILAPYDQSFDVGGGNMTIATFIKVLSNPTIVTPYVWNMLNDTRGYEIRLKINRKIEFTIFAGSGPVVISQNPVPFNTWVHTATVRDNGQLRIYINGELQGTNGSTTDGSAPGHDLAICAELSGTDKRYLHGSIDEVRIYNRALTEAEIQVLSSN